MADRGLETPGELGPPGGLHLQVLDLAGLRPSPRPPARTGLRPSRRLRHLLRAVLPLFVLLLLAALPLLRGAYPQAYPTVPLPPLVCTDIHHPLLLTIIDDRSTSTWSTDPQHRREPELRRVVEHLAAQACHRNDRAGAIHFDDVVPPTTPQVLDPPGLERVLEGIPGYGEAPSSSSDVVPSLQRARTWTRAHPDHLAVTVIATDGMVLQEEEVEHLVARMPGDVHVLVLGGELPNWWDDVPITSAIPLSEHVALGEVATQVFAVIAEASDRR